MQPKDNEELHMVMEQAFSEHAISWKNANFI